MKNKLKVLTSLFLIVTLSISSAYLFLPEYFQSLDNRVRDFYFNYRGPTKASDEVVIVDIDERSIRELGQWPWERDKFAQILVNLTNAGTGIIGLDIVFAEEDKTSPVKFAKKWNLEIGDLPDYDEVLAQTVADTPTILGYVFDFDTNDNDHNDAPQIPAIFIEKNKAKAEFLPLANGVLPNLEVIQDAAYSSGYMNNIPDETGVIRSVPLLIKFDEVLYPSLAFEMYRIANNVNKVIAYYSDAGIENVTLAKQPIRTDRFGRMHLNFRGPFKSYKYISAVDVYNNDIDPKDLEGKFVLIGTSAYGLMDLRSTPMDSVIAGVELHANMIDNLIHDDMLSKPSWGELADLFMIFLVVFIVMFLFSRLAIIPLVLVFLLSLGGIMYLNYYLLFTAYIILNSIFPIMAMFLSLTTVLGVNYMFEYSQKEMIKGKFASKVSADVMEDILKNPESNTLDGAEKEITVFFSDVRNFTNISEAMGNAKSLIKFMNEIMEPMTTIIINEKGTVDKYIGDAIMAYWNAPVDVDNHADRAVRASLKQLHALNALNDRLRANPEYENVIKMADNAGQPIVDIGIGLNSGVAIVGEMGSTIRSDYTVIGDPINLGARLESLCKYYNSKLNISHFTKKMLTGDYIYRFLDLVTVKGKAEPIEIWQIHNFNEEDAPPLFYSTREELLKELDLYHKAIELYKASDFTDALAIFQDINSWEHKSNKAIYTIYIERCEHYIEVPPENFNGVFQHTTKG
ncbi:adenylate/guanylate cyclase domain-containing protein [Sulfurimonas sp. SAG-AH-194-I05]|nr:adenylate/guanylate cyclase domain-containing protein [Sulfurimonas sp. SAG-AH-194-I05]MDF1874874.1 adenylate/guanylate cyclase domain-containing protein [Sulfurimonas sp. SAG-AH-194-I05]